MGRLWGFGVVECVGADRNLSNSGNVLGLAWATRVLSLSIKCKHWLANHKSLA